MNRGVVGRARELEAVDRLLGLLDDGPGVLVLEGEPGIGKTTVVRHGIEAGDRIGARVLTCAGSAAESRLSYSGLADLLGTVDGEPLEELPPPQRTALDEALLRSRSPGARVDRRAVAAAACSMLEALARERPVLVAIDDLQWLDAPSRRVVEYFARRLPPGVGLLASRRTDDAWELADLVGLGDPERMQVARVEALEPREVRQLLDARGCLPPQRRLAARVVELSGGNPFYALELAEAVPEGTAPGDFPLPARLGEVVAARTAGLGAEEADVLLTAAALADPRMATLELACGAGAGAAIGAAEERGVVSVTGGRVAFAHPLLAEGVYSQAPAAKREAIHRRLSEVVVDGEERARHLAAARILPEALEALERAAAQLRLRGAPDGAAELLEMALELGAERELEVALAAHLFDAGDTRRAVAVLEGVIDSLPQGDARREALLLLGEIKYKDDSFPEALVLLERAREEAGSDERMLLMIDLRLSFTLFNLGRIPEAGASATSARRIAERLGEDALLAQALAVHTIVSFALGLPLDEASLDRALALQDQDQRTGAELYPSLIAAFIYMWAGRYEEAREQQDLVCAQYEARGEEQALAWASFTRVWVEFSAGDARTVETAADLADERLSLLETLNARALAEACRGAKAAFVGRAEEARRQCERSLASFKESGWVTWSWFPAVTVAWLALSLSEPAEAARSLDPLVAMLRTIELADPAPAGMLFAGDAAEALIALGRIDEAIPILERLEEGGESLDRVWAIAVGARCRGLLQAAEGDLSAAEASLERAVGCHDRLAMPVERGRNLLALGQIRRRARRRRAARESLQEALTEFEGVGTPRWAELAQAELERLGVPAADPYELTPSERRVAQLAASGLTNREVAEELVISPKTVEAHLARAYRKLGIHSRAELGARMIADADSGA